MDKIVDKIAALGVTGIVLLVAISATGWAGAAAMTAALAALGGPVGMVGGVGVLVIAALITKGLATYGFEKMFVATAKRLQDKGMPLTEIRHRVETYPISRDLKIKILYHLGTGNGADGDPLPVR